VNLLQLIHKMMELPISLVPVNPSPEKQFATCAKPGFHAAPGKVALYLDSEAIVQAAVGLPIVAAPGHSL
jgi:hypothetical protein